jgi:acetyl-CoA carboxylase alpha subunit
VTLSNVANAIMHRDVTHAPELAARQGITADVLADRGIIGASVLVRVACRAAPYRRGCRRWAS